MQTFNVQLDSDAIQAVINVAMEEGYLDDYIQDEIEHRLEDVSTLIDYAVDNMDAIAEQACVSGSQDMIVAFIDAKPDVVAEAISCRDGEVFEALKALYEDDSDIKELFQNIVAFVNEGKESE